MRCGRSWGWNDAHDGSLRQLAEAGSAARSGLGTTVVFQLLDTVCQRFQFDLQRAKSSSVAALAHLHRRRPLMKLGQEAGFNALQSCLQFGANTADLLANAGDLGANTADFLANAGDFGANTADFGANATQFTPNPLLVVFCQTHVCT